MHAAGSSVSHLSAAGGGLGFGLPAAVGAQLAAPDRRSWPRWVTVNALRDHVAVDRYALRLPLTIVVASNSGYGILKEFGVIEDTTGGPGFDSPGLDIVATARSYGVDAHQATTTDDVAEALERRHRRPRPTHPDQRHHHTR